MLRPLVAAALALSIMPAMAQDKVYYLHSSAQGDCPALTWHIVAHPDGVLSGVVVSDDRKLVVMLTGVINPVENVQRDAKSQGNTAETKTFGMMATEFGGRNRNADVTGTIEPNGWLNADIKGALVACEHIRVPLFVPAGSP